MDKNKIIQAATKYVQKGQFDKAIAEYQKVIREDPRDVRVLLKVGELHQKRGDNALAASMLLQVAESYSGDGFFLKAVAVYKQILKLDPSRVDVNVRLAELYQQLGLMSDAMGQFQIVANHHDREGKLTELADVLRRMVDLDPENVASRIKLAEMFARQGATRDAIAEFRKAAAQLKNAGRPDDYVKVGERIVFLDPSDVVLARELASVHLARGDTKRALAKLQACFKTDPHDVETLTLLARAFLDLGQTSKTIAVYKELARIHGESERVDDERATWRRVLELDPEDPDARAAVAHSRPAPQPLVPDVAPAPEPPAPVPGEGAARPPPSPRPPAAASAPRASPGDPVGKLLTETDVYVKYGLHDKALEHLRKIFQLEPGNLEAHEKAAELLLTAGNQAVGLEELVTVCRLCVERGEIERGRAHFAHLAHLAPHLPAVAELQSALAAGAPHDDDAIVIEAADELVEESNPDEHGEDVIIGEVDEDAGIEIVSDVEEIDDSTRDMLLPEVAVSAEEEVVLAPEPEPEPGELVDEPLFGGPVAEEELTGEIDLALSQGPQESATPGPEEGSGWNVQSESQLTAYAATPGPEEVVADPEVEAAFAAADGAQVLVEEEVEGEELGEEIELSSEPAPPSWSPPEYQAEPELEPELEPDGYEAPQELPSEELPAEEHLHPNVAQEPAAFEAQPDEPENPWSLDADDLAEIETELQEAEFFIAQDLLDEAEEACTSILFRAPGHPVATARLAEIEAMRGGPGSAPVEVASSFDLAAELASEVGPEQPTDLDEFQYSVEDVLEEFKRGVSQTVKPEDTQTHYDLGIAYKEMGLLQEAIGEFEVAMQGSRGKPAEIECLHMIGLCKVALGKPLEGAGFLEQALRAPRIGADAARAIEYELASALEACGDAPRALFHFGKVAAVDAGYRDVGQAVARLQAAGVVAAPPSERERNGAVAPEAARPGASARKIGYV